jgi:hypothetical protein
VQTALEAARAWLRTQRGADGGWSYRPGQASRPEPSVLVAAAGVEAPISWLEGRALGWAGRLVPTALRYQPGSELLRARELERLLAQRSRTGLAMEDFDASLPAWGWVEGTAGWTEPTAHALLALRTAGHHDDARAREAQAFLLDRQGADGGWNYGNPRVLGKDLDSAPVATGWTLLALTGLATEPCSRGLAWLEAFCAALPTTHSLAMLVLAEVALDRDPGSSARALLERQQPSGGFADRVDLTALAAAALAAAVGEPCPLLSRGS